MGIRVGVGVGTGMAVAEGVGTGMAVAEGVGAGLSVAGEARFGEGTGITVGVDAAGSIARVEDDSTGALGSIV